MKKFISLFLTLVICLSFISCAKELEGRKEFNKKETKAETEFESEKEDISSNEPLDEVEKAVEYTPLLYKVTDPEDGSIIWLFGSIHLGVEGMIPLPDYVMDAYNSSKALAVECNIREGENDIALQTELLSYMVYGDGSTISDHIPKELYDKAVEIFKENNSYNKFFDYYMPVLWQSFIEQLVYENAGLSSDYGIDGNLLDMAIAEGKEILEVESLEFQYSMLADFSPELQTYLLEDAVESYYNEETNQDLAEIVDSWCAGDEAAIIESNETDLNELTKYELVLFEEFNNAMIVDRNINMAQYAENALINDEEIFICVGAAHVVGEGAMADLLEKSGYKVEIIKG